MKHSDIKTIYYVLCDTKSRLDYVNQHEVELELMAAAAGTIEHEHAMHRRQRLESRIAELDGIITRLVKQYRI